MGERKKGKDPERLLGKKGAANDPDVDKEAKQSCQQKLKANGVNSTTMTKYDELEKAVVQPHQSQ